MSWIKNKITDSVIGSILDAILNSNPDLYVAIDLLDEITLLEVIRHYYAERKKLDLPPRKPIDWLSYADMAIRVPFTKVIVRFLQVEFGITAVSDMDIEELLDSFTKIGSNGK